MHGVRGFRQSPRTPRFGAGRFSIRPASPFFESEQGNDIAEAKERHGQEHPIPLYAGIWEWNPGRRVRRPARVQGSQQRPIDRQTEGSVIPANQKTGRSPAKTEAIEGRLISIAMSRHRCVTAAPRDPAADCGRRITSPARHGHASMRHVAGCPRLVARLACRTFRQIFLDVSSGPNHRHLRGREVTTSPAASRPPESHVEPTCRREGGLYLWDFGFPDTPCPRALFPAKIPGGRFPKGSNCDAELKPTALPVRGCL